VDVFLRELEYLKYFDHPNIVRFHEVYEDENKFHLVLEYLSGGELLSRIINEGAMLEKDVKNTIWQMLLGVNYLHHRKICHRDLKPENFMFRKPGSKQLKLIDFGLSANFGVRGLRTIAGSDYYIAPDVLEQDYDERCDSWSIGVVMYYLITGTLPFVGNTQLDIHNKILIGEWDSTLVRNRSISKAGQNLLTQLLQRDKRDRIRPSHAIRHPFFKEYRDEHRSNENRERTIELVEKMRIFWNYSWFQKECVKLMVQAFDGEEEIEKMKCVYFYLDTDYSGSIEIDELTNFYKENHGMKSAADLDKIVAEMNEYYLKEPGVINFTE
jgi:calcium-dependent protein kinase